MIKLGDRMKKIKIVSIFFLLICLTGCGYGENELYCKNKGSAIAKEYLKEKYNIDVEIIDAEPDMTDQSCFDATCYDGYATGPVEVIADYNGREIIVNVNCFEDIEPTDDIYSDYRLSDYSNCITYDGMYFCSTPNVNVSKYGENDVKYEYGYGYNDSTQLTPSYKLEPLEKSNNFLRIFIPVNKLDTTFLENNRMLARSEYSGSLRYETFDLHKTKDRNYYVVSYRLYPGLESAVFTIIK